MIRRFGHILLLMLAFCTLFSACKSDVQSSRPTIPFIEQLLADQGREAELLLSYDPYSPKGDIVIVDEPERCEELTDAFSNCDIFDNGNASLHPDLLPDFAGEVILGLADKANAPYEGYLGAGNESYLRELTVKTFIAALDTICSLNTYDKDFGARKAPAKMVVLSSPYMAAYGKFDVDTLCLSFGADIPVISSVHEVFSRAVSGIDEPTRVLMAVDPKVAPSEVYKTIFKEVNDIQGVPANELITVVPDSLGVSGLMKNILSLYSDTGARATCDVIVVDDYNLDVKELYSQLEQMKNSLDPEDERLVRFVSSKLSILSSRDVVMESCYRTLRSRNLFTHKIAYPMVDFYYLLPFSGMDDDRYSTEYEFKDEYKYNREQLSPNKDFTVVRYSERYLDRTAVEQKQSPEADV